MFSTVRSCYYEKQLCRGGGEPARCFVLSALSVLIVFIFWLFFLSFLFFFILFVVLPTASPPGRVHDSDPMGGHDRDSPIDPGQNVQLCRSFVTTELVSQEIARTLGVVDVCVVHIKPFFLSVNIQHTQCPCRFFLLERYKLCGHKTTTQRYYILTYLVVSRVDNGMTCRRTGYYRNGIPMLAIQMR